MLNANEVGGGVKMQKELLEAGVYPGRLVQVIDLGMQEQRDWQGEKKGPKYELMVTYEFSDEFMKDEDGKDLLDKPRWLSETFPFFNLTQEKATSTKRYRALDPNEAKKGDWGELLSTPVNITVIVNAGKGKNLGKFYENIAGISPMRAKDVEKLPALVNPTKVFDLGNPDLDVFKALPEWIRDKIKGNLEFAASPLSVLLGDVVPTSKEVEDAAEARAEDAAAEAAVEPSTETIEGNLPEEGIEAHVENDGEEIPF